MCLSGPIGGRFVQCCSMMPFGDDFPLEMTLGPFAFCFCFLDETLLPTRCATVTQWDGHDFFFYSISHGQQQLCLSSSTLFPAAVKSRHQDATYCGAEPNHHRDRSALADFQINIQFYQPTIFTRMHMCWVWKQRFGPTVWIAEQNLENPMTNASN